MCKSALFTPLTIIFNVFLLPAGQRINIKAVSAFPGNLLKIQNLKPIESEAFEWSLEICVLVSPPGNFNVHLSLRSL